MPSSGRPQGRPASSGAHPACRPGRICPALIKPLTAVEEHCFQRVFPGEDHTINMSADVPAGPAGGEVLAPPAGRRARSPPRSVPVSYPFT
jgi:hypothetical protein